MLPLDGRVALISDGTHPMGVSIAKILAESGCRVAICSRYRENLYSTVDDIGPKASAHLCDVSSPYGLEHMIQKITDKYGVIDYIIQHRGTNYR